MSQDLVVRQAHSSATDPVVAVNELAAGLGRDADALLFFCSASYDLPRLGAALKAAFPGPVAGCTSSGQIGPDGFTKGGITAVSLSGGAVKLHPFFLAPLAECRAGAARLADTIRCLGHADGERSFGVILVDGLSMAEEKLTAALYQSLGNVPIIGGSAGDDLAFERTHVYHDGAFHTDAALFLLFDTALPFTTFRFQHFRPTETRLVVTKADPARRIVYEINGEPAAEAYAAAIGTDVASLSATVFSGHPVMINIGGEYYVRSFHSLHPDGGLALFCAIEEGLVLRVAEGVDAMATLEGAFADLHQRVGPPAFVLGCDCILRRLEFEERGVAAQVGRFMADHHVIGFSTYGEQFNAVHVNQTFTGVAIGHAA